MIATTFNSEAVYLLPYWPASMGSAEFEARVSNSEDSIEWTLSYRDIPTPVLQAHIHFGQRALGGGISIFLCTNIGNAPAGTFTAACPPTGGTIGGVITANDVVGPAAQGIAPSCPSSTSAAAWSTAAPRPFCTSASPPSRTSSA